MKGAKVESAGEEEPVDGETEDGRRSRNKQAINQSIHYHQGTIFPRYSRLGKVMNCKLS
jgi:hypothetical protein